MRKRGDVEISKDKDNNKNNISLIISRTSTKTTKIFFVDFEGVLSPKSASSMKKQNLIKKKVKRNQKFQSFQ